MKIERVEGFEEVIIYTSNPRISCSGENYDHPKVWYDVPQDGTYAVCGYCDIKFAYRPDDSDHWTDETEGIKLKSRGFNQ